jgi:hypothetical protein
LQPLFNDHRFGYFVGQQHFFGDVGGVVVELGEEILQHGGIRLAFGAFQQEVFTADELAVSG